VRVTQHPTTDGAKLNLIVAAGPEDGDRGLVLSGHMDVVPAESVGWESDPFTLTRRDGCYVARGAADMKGFLALAINRLASADIPRLRHQLVLLFTHDEETGTLGARRLVDEQGALPPLPRATIIGEPTSLRVLRMHKGHLRLRLSFTGVPAHSGLPHLGVNAIEAAGRAIVALTEFREALERERPPNAEHFPEVPYVTLNVARVAGGGATNVVPADCVLDLGIRLLPGMSADEMTVRVRAVVQEAVSRVPFELAVLGETPPMITLEDAPIVRLLATELGQTENGSAPFGTDGGWLSRLGLDCVIWGPGSIEVAHKPNESLPVAEFVRAGELLTRVVHRACSAAQA
jgi:acetylornithine deacetylase